MAAISAMPAGPGAVTGLGLGPTLGAMAGPCAVRAPIGRLALCSRQARFGRSARLGQLGLVAEAGQSGRAGRPGSYTKATGQRATSGPARPRGTAGTPAARRS